MCVHICYRTLAFNNVVKVSLEFNYSSKIMSFHLKPSLERLFLILLQVNNYFVIRYELFQEYIELRAFRLLNCFSISVSLWFFQKVVSCSDTWWISQDMKILYFLAFIPLNGISNTPNTLHFMHLMKHIFKSFIGNFVFIYFDDILIYRKKSKGVFRASIPDFQSGEWQ